MSSAHRRSRCETHSEVYAMNVPWRGHALRARQCQSQWVPAAAAACVSECTAAGCATCTCRVCSRCALHDSTCANCANFIAQFRHVSCDVTVGTYEGLGRTTMTLGTILLIILILALIGAIPSWPYSRSWGYYPSGGVGLILLIVIILFLLGRI